jgi:hypothetical protein
MSGVSIGAPVGGDTPGWIERSLRQIERWTVRALGSFTFNGSAISTADESITVTLDSDGTPLTALTLGGIGPLGRYGHTIDVGNNELGALFIKGSHDGFTNGPGLIIYYDSPTPAATDLVSYIDFVGQDSDGADEIYGAIHGRATVLTAGSETGTMEFQIKRGGVGLSSLTLGGTGSDATTGQHVFSGNNAAQVVEVNTTHSGANGAYFVTYHNSPSPADNDEIGGLIIRGEDDGGNAVTYAYVAGYSTDVNVGTGLDGRIEFGIQKAGSLGAALRLDADGLKFNGDTAAANALADYEEGSWSPTLTTDDVDFDSVTYDAARAGSYTKIGDVVHIQGVMQTDAVTAGAASGSVVIGNLPFASVSGSGGVSCAYAAAWAGEEPLHCLIGASSSEILLLYRAAVTGDVAFTAVADVGTGADANQLIFAGTYRAA